MQTVPDSHRNYNVVVAIVAYHCEEAVHACVRSLSKLDYISFEIHIIENAGAEAYSKLISALSDLVAFSSSAPQKLNSGVDVLRGNLLGRSVPVMVCKSPRNVGFAGGVNRIIQSITSSNWDAVWVLNPDTRVDPAALAALVEYSRSKNMSIVGSRLIHGSTDHIQMYGGHWRTWMARGLAIGLGSPVDLQPDTEAVERQLDFVSGASMLVSRAYIERVGLMDEEYFLYCEEVDWCFRRCGLRLGYCHASIVYHDHGLTTGASMSRKTLSPLTVYLDERNKLVLTRKFFPKRFPAVVLVCLVLTSQYLAAGAIHNFLIALQGWWAGVRGQRGFPQKILQASGAGTTLHD